MWDVDVEKGIDKYPDDVEIEHQLTPRASENEGNEAEKTKKKHMFLQLPELEFRVRRQWKSATRVWMTIIICGNLED